MLIILLVRMNRVKHLGAADFRGILPVLTSSVDLPLTSYGSPRAHAWYQTGLIFSPGFIINMATVQQR